MMKVLIDTNVIIDALQGRDNFAKDAELVVLQAYEYDGFVVATSVTDIFYIQRRYYHNKERAKENLEKILKIYSVLDVTNIDCYSALRSDIPDYEDAVLIESARRNDIDCIVTRDTKDFQNSNIPIYTPVEFLKKLRDKR